MKNPRTRIVLTFILPLFLLLAVPFVQARPWRTPIRPSGEGLQFRLEEGRPGKSAGPTGPQRPSKTVLSAQAVNGLLASLPALPPSETTGFRMREKSLPRPRTGNTVTEPFPPAPVARATPTVSGGGLSILRHAPDGNVPIVPQLSATFSRPMVPVTSLADLATVDVPVKLSPQPPGKWRWIGTRTVVFEPADARFPMATAYSAVVPAGTKDAAGDVLAHDTRWAFTTPPPQVRQFTPQGGPTERAPLMTATFDQKVDPTAVLATIKSTPASAFRLATRAELEKAEIAPSDRLVAFVPTRPYPTATEVTVTIGPGTPSLEGPLKSDRPQTFSFNTYGPMRIQGSGCSYGAECPPLAPWYVIFTNPVDSATFKPEMVRVTPALPNMKVQVIGRYLNISGQSRGRTRYTVNIDSSLRDTFGQNLTESKPLVFQVGSAAPALAGPSDNFIVADPFAPPAFSVFSINHPTLRVRLYEVTPADWPAYMAMIGHVNDEKFPTPPGKLVSNSLVQTKATPDELTETDLDLRGALHQGLGNVVVVVEPPVQPKERWQRRVVVAWVESTHIGIDAFVDPSDLLAFATRLTDGHPMPNVHVSLSGDPTTATTDSNGLATLPLPAKAATHCVLIARDGEDVAFLPESKYFWNNGSSWVRRMLGDSIAWYVFDDRGIYKPNETVHFKGWMRRVGAGPKGDVGGLGDNPTSVHYSVVDSRYNEVAKGDVPVDAFGGIHGVFKLPDNVNLGEAQLRLSVPRNGSATTHSFQIEEFRRPEFEVSASAQPGPYVIGDSANVTTDAKYYAGGALANADVTWTVTSTPSAYSPPGHDEFTFGRWIPWFYYFDAPSEDSGTTSKTFHAKTDAAGEHIVKIDFDGVRPPLPSSVTAEATVMDVNRQAWSASAHMLVHPASEYVGLRRIKLFVNAGEALDVDAIVTDIEGKIQIGRPIELHVSMLDWEYRDGRYQRTESHPQDIVLTSGAQPVSTSLHPSEGGTWRIRATITDPQGRKNESETTFWVSGGKQPPEREVKAEKLMLVPDKKEYQPGETAHILIQSPFAGGHGVYYLGRDGFVETHGFDLTGTSATIDVPIKDEYLPGLDLGVEVTGAGERTNDAGKTDAKLAKRSAYAVGSLTLPIPPVTRGLKVTARPQAAACKPGSQTAVDVTVVDANGHPAADSQVALVVVDESVLALTGYRLIDPLNVFYAMRGSGVNAVYGRADMVLANPFAVTGAGLFTNAPGGPFPTATGVAGAFVPVSAAKVQALPAAPMARRAMSAKKQMEQTQQTEQKIAMRSNFDPLAVFAPAVRTDKNGHATVSFKLPDNLTRYRVMAVAVHGDRQFGAGESTITARLPLMVRPSAPRFLNFGDRFELPVVLQNQTNRPMRVEVAARASNVKLADGGYALTVPANDRVEVLFPSATEEAGTARFQVAARSADGADAATFSLPVYTPATTEAFATYGVVDENGAVGQPVKAPTDVYAQFGQLEVELSSTALQALTDAVVYLVRYPYECAEQVSSRVIGVVALRDVLTAFHSTELPSAKELNESVSRDIEKLKSLQNDDGGFAFWQHGDPSWPFISVHVANALVRAKQKGYAVPPETLANALKYLRDVESHIPHWYGEDCRNAIIAYALNVRWRMGDRDLARARRLIAAGLPAASGNAPAKEHLSVEAVGWLLPVVALTSDGKSDPSSAPQLAILQRYLNNRVSETAGMANFTTQYEDGRYLLLSSDRRADAVVLEALVQTDPRNDLIPKIVRGLLGHRSAGHWLNTQENVFVLLALDRYFNAYEKQTPDFVARVWLGDGYAGDQTFKSRSTNRYDINVPMAQVVAGPSEKNLVIDKQGAGRLYYRIGMQYAPKDLDLKPLEAGFTVQRIYEAVDNKDDVKREADGTWVVRAGARVKVHLTMVCESRRVHVALVDPLPAGFEALNPALAVQGALPMSENERRPSNPWWYWLRPWYEHQNLRDERAEAFTSLLWEGVYDYTYFARATTPGHFIVPPPKAEEMYSPEVFGRGATDRVEVR